MKRIIAHIDMDAFFPAVEALLNPDLKGLPVIVGSKPWERGIVSSCSYEARKFGVHSGMSSHEAGRLCPHGIFIHGHFNEYSKHSRIISEVFLSYTPYVEMISCDEAFLDFTDCKLLYPNMKLALQSVQGEITKKTGGLTCSVGVGTSKTIAKIASDYDKPKGFVWVEEGGEAKFLRPLKLRDMFGIGPHMEGRLKRLGFKTLGDIQGVPDEKIFQKFGRVGVELKQRCLGIDDSEVVTEREPKSISKETTFSVDTSDFKKVLGTLRLLSDRVATTMRLEGKEARTISVKIRYDDFSTFLRSKTLTLSVDSTKKLWHTVKALFLENYNRFRKIRLAGVKVSNFERKVFQGSLFDFLERGRVKKLKAIDKQIDKIRLRYGESAIKSL